MCRKNEEVKKVLCSKTFGETVTELELDYQHLKQSLSDIIVTQFQTYLTDERLQYLKKNVPAVTLTHESSS